RVEVGEAHRAGPLDIGVVEEAVDVLEVGAGAERPVARPGEHEHVGRLVGAEGEDRFGQSDRRLGVDAVVDLGTVEGDDRDRPPLFSQYLRHGGEGYALTSRWRDWPGWAIRSAPASIRFCFCFWLFLCGPSSATSVAGGGRRRHLGALSRWGRAGGDDVTTAGKPTGTVSGNEPTWSG